LLAKRIKIIIGILSFVLLFVLVGYVVYRFIIPMHMRRALYKIEQINVADREIDISQFRELIPHAKYTIKNS
jgi:hypothetical protein